jgi:hypothetical protein
MAIGPPMITPTVPVKNIIIALFPRPRSALISMLSIKSIKAPGNNSLLAT